MKARETLGAINRNLIRLQLDAADLRDDPDYKRTIGVGGYTSNQMVERLNAYQAALEAALAAVAAALVAAGEYEQTSGGMGYGLDR